MNPIADRQCARGTEPPASAVQTPGEVTTVDSAVDAGQVGLPALRDSLLALIKRDEPLTDAQEEDLLRIVEAQMTHAHGWRDISSAPKDGTRIVIYREGWEIAPLAEWGDYPANPVVGVSHKPVWIAGWLLEDEYLSIGHEDGFLGWKEDPMPTHWLPAPPAVKGV